MTIEEKLNLIGFKGFVHLKKELRDNKRRKFFSSNYNDKEFNIMIVEKDNKWIIEKLEDAGLISNVLALKNSEIHTSELILFFKNFYYKNDEISQLL
ncbi:hypothetical protein J2786_003012 [Chryseobacterium vietnamense]|uniref:Uncharacterized protein n=1 Tax=Chryseobacterium vietnamense TaxID=866785 RepID=A0ACC6J9Z2_9FLAO|nr:hypothetical protein [Chryseobacterium vietnamense]MDR6459889.1 hypothetical protein [Chryseobacterium vietnamense]